MWPSRGSRPRSSCPGTATGESLLSVAAVIPGKGHDVLARRARDAERTVAGGVCCVGTLERDPAYVATLRRRALDRGMDGRVRFSGALPEEDLARSYRAADLLVLPSRSETYGMVVTEALARGLPVVAAEVGGVPEALGHGADGTRPGLLVPGRRPCCARRRAARLARGSRSPPSLAAGGAGAARVARRTGRRRRRPWQTSWRGRRDDRRGDPGQPGLARPARARGRRGPLARPRPETAASASGRRSARRPRPRLRQRLDGTVARAASARAAALDPARPRPGPAGARRGRDPPAAPSRSRPGCPTSRGSTPRIWPGRRSITASALLDLLTAGGADAADRRLRRRRVPGADRSLRHRSRPAAPAGSTRRPDRGCVQRAPAPPDAARTPARPGCGGSRRCGVPRSRSRGRRQPQPLAARRLRRATSPSSGSPAGSTRRASRSPRWPRGRPLPPPPSERGRSRLPSRSPSATPTCWCCREQRPPVGRPCDLARPCSRS